MVVGRRLIHLDDAETHAAPRQIAYRTDGVYYDAGVVWRPNRRVSAEARVGKRFGSISMLSIPL